VSSIIYDTVALSIPLQHAHPDGECNEATWQALQEHTAHNIVESDDNDGTLYATYADDAQGDTTEDDNERNIDPRWAELMKLKDNKLKNK